jgi:glycosyltransferase involved in cell wall biosynthesis
MSSALKACVVPSIIEPDKRAADLAQTLDVDRNRPVLSICVPSYNRSALLLERLAELDAPDFLPFPYEVIVVDNASTDPGYLAVAAARPANHAFRYYRRSKNIGGEPNIFMSYRLARGEFCVHLCDDDHLITDQLAVIVANMRATPHVIATYAAWHTIDVTTRETVERHSFGDLLVQPGEAETLARALPEWSLSIPENAVYRTDAIARASFPRSVNNYPFTLLQRLFAFGAIHFSSKPYYMMTIDRVGNLVDGGRMSSSYRFVGWSALARSFGIFHHWATGERLYCIGSGIERKLFLNLNRNAVYEAQHQGRLTEALEVLDYLDSITDLELVTPEYRSTLRFLASIEAVGATALNLPGVDCLQLVGLDVSIEALVRQTIVDSDIELSLRAAPFPLGLDPSGSAFLTMTDLARDQIIQLYGLPPGFVFSLESLKLAFGF